MARGVLANQAGRNQNLRGSEGRLLASDVEPALLSAIPSLCASESLGATRSLLRTGMLTGTSCLYIHSWLARQCISLLLFVVRRHRAQVGWLIDRDRGRPSDRTRHMARRGAHPMGIVFLPRRYLDQKPPVFPWINCSRTLLVTWRSSWECFCHRELHAAWTLSINRAVRTVFIWLLGWQMSGLGDGTAKLPCTRPASPGRTCRILGLLGRTAWMSISPLSVFGDLMREQLSFGNSVRRNNLRHGLSLVEVLVVVGILSALVGISAPAIMYAREASRLVDCQNRLRQIGLAALSFESQRHFLPPGILGTAMALPSDSNYREPTSEFYWRRYQYTSSLALILPFLEDGSRIAQLPSALFDVEHSLSHFVNPRNQPLFRWFGDIPGAVTVATQTIALYRCPSDSFGETAVLEYKGAIQPVYSAEIADEAIASRDLFVDTGVRLGMTNYAGCMGADAGGIPLNAKRRRYVGLMSSREKLRLSDATDGTSKTILYGEILGRISDKFLPGQRYIVQTWMFGGLSRGRGELDWPKPPDEIQLLGDGTKAGTFGFASSHSDGVGFVAADGHTFSLGRDVDWQIFYGLCGRADTRGN
jgi:type II secretory pathway pseudopilin PulG